MVKEAEFIVSGDVQGVGYRQYVAKVGRKLKLVGFAENLKDGTVRIQCKGNETAISEFKKLINVQRPEAAPLVTVDSIEEKQLTQGTVKETIFEEKYGDANAEMAQGFSTGMNYMNLFRAESHANFNKMDNTLNGFKNESTANFNRMDNTLNEFKNESHANFNKMDNTLNGFKNESTANFKHMDEKYDKISQGMFAVVAGMEKRMEKTDKNIESLLKILAEKKN